MATKKGKYIMYGDDGKLYHVNREDLYATPVKDGEDAAKQRAAMKELAPKLKKAAGTAHPFECVFMFADKATAKAKSPKD